MKSILISALFLAVVNIASAYPPPAGMNDCHDACVKSYKTAKTDCQNSDNGWDDCSYDVCSADVACHKKCYTKYGGLKYVSKGYTQDCADYIDFPECKDKNTTYVVGSDGLHYGWENDQSCLKPYDYTKTYGYEWS
ncbi:hypothetical protein HK098_001896 [Nowakowskiella sp. JEL0407]|nr:hypothetical protein HK098_001896 [Nowakowskiella sp. JEL0407]